MKMIKAIADVVHGQQKKSEPTRARCSAHYQAKSRYQKPIHLIITNAIILKLYHHQSLF